MIKRQKEQIEWKSKNIYWHKVIWMDEERIKEGKLTDGHYVVGNLYGFQKIEKQWKVLDKKKKDITPYIIFKYVGKTPYFKDAKKRKKAFNEFKKQKGLI